MQLLLEQLLVWHAKQASMELQQDYLLVQIVLQVLTTLQLAAQRHVVAAQQVPTVLLVLQPV